jgi:hypothetical protein
VAVDAADPTRSSPGRISTDEGAEASAALIARVTGDELWAATWVHTTPASIVMLMPCCQPTILDRVMAPPAPLRSARQCGPRRVDRCSIRPTSQVGSHPTVGDFAAFTLARFVAGPTVPRRRLPVTCPLQPSGGPRTGSLVFDPPSRWSGA